MIRKSRDKKWNPVYWDHTLTLFVSFSVIIYWLQIKGRDINIAPPPAHLSFNIGSAASPWRASAFIWRLYIVFYSIIVRRWWMARRVLHNQLCAVLWAACILHYKTRRFNFLAGPDVSARSIDFSPPPCSTCCLLCSFSGRMFCRRRTRFLWGIDC